MTWVHPHERKEGECAAIVPRPPRITRLSYSRDFISMPVDIERYVSDLVPFEFARRGIHVVVEKLPERNIKADDASLSRFYPGSKAISGEGLLRKSSMNEPASVTGVYKLGANQKSPFAFEHDGHSFELSWSEPDEESLTEVMLCQLDAGCCYDGRENIEYFVIVPGGETDFVGEFNRGNIVYSPGRHGRPAMGEVETDADLQFLLLHGMTLYVPHLRREALPGAYLLVLKSDILPFCRYFWFSADRDDVIKPWRFDLEESPEWALENAGQPPLS